MVRGYSMISPFFYGSEVAKEPYRYFPNDMILGKIDLDLLFVGHFASKFLRDNLVDDLV